MDFKVYFSFLLYFGIINGSKILKETVDPSTPALMARYILHNVDWVTVTSISTMQDIKSYPYGSLEEVVDGLDDKGNGIPYFYVAVFDPLTIDTEKDDRCTLVASLAETSWCKEKNLEQEDPRCARVMISGSYVRVNNTSEEYTNAVTHIHNKHPQTKYWPGSHHFYVAKMDIQHINLFDSFGGIKTIPVKDYLNANDKEFDNNV